MTSYAPTRRGLLTAAAAVGGAALAPTSIWRATPALATAPAILKPTPPAWFRDFGTNAEILWSSVDPKAYLTPQAWLFVRNHTRTPMLTRAGYALRVYGDGLATARTEGEALSLTLDDLQRLPHHELTTVHECTGNGRSFFKEQQGQTVAGTAWTLGAVGTVRWRGVRLRDVLTAVGLSPDAVSVQATGLDDPYVSGGTDHGRVRRPFPVEKALDDAILAWGMNGEDLLPDHGFPLRLVLPGWVGIASIKWLGSLEVSRSELSSPWNTTWYRMTGPTWPADSSPLTVNPVRSAWELAAGAVLPSRPVTLTGRSWSERAPSPGSPSAWTAVLPGVLRSSTAGRARTWAGRSGRCAGATRVRVATSCWPVPPTRRAARSRSRRPPTARATSSTRSCATRCRWSEQTARAIHPRTVRVAEHLYEVEAVIA